MLNPSVHIVYKLMYNFETRTVPIWRHFSHNFFNYLVAFLIDLILDTSSNILNRIQVRTIAKPFQYGHFSPLNYCLWGLRHLLGLFTKFMRFNVAIYVSLQTAGLSLLVISCFNLSTPSFFPLLTSSAKHLWSAASKILAYKHLSCTVLPPILWWIVQLYTKQREKYLRIVITTGKHFILL